MVTLKQNKYKNHNFNSEKSYLPLEQKKDIQLLSTNGQNEKYSSGKYKRIRA